MQHLVAERLPEFDSPHLTDARWYGTVRFLNTDQQREKEAR